MNDDDAREAARALLRDVVRADRYVSIPDHATVQRAANGDAFVEAVVEVPALMLKARRRG